MKRAQFVKILSLIISLIMINYCLVSCGDKDTEPTCAWYKESSILAAGTDAFDYSTVPERPDDWQYSAYEYYDLPEDTVESMSSQGLLITTLDYPLMVCFYAFNSLVGGFNVIKSAYLPLRELTQRDGTAEMLDSFYASVNYADVKKTDEDYPIKMRFLEMLIADDDVVSKADSKTRASIIKSGIEKIAENQMKYDNEFGTNTTVYMVSKYLYYDSEEFKNLVDSDEDVKNFVSGKDTFLSSEADEEVVDKIIEFATEYVENLE